MQQRRIFLAAVAVSLVLTACGRDDGDGDATAPGVTDEPCPNAVNEDHGCIYLGILSDLTEGPFAALGGPITDAQKAFWQRVNEQGGIGDYDIDVETYIRDNKYNPETHNQLYQEIKTNVLALAQTLGTPTTQAIVQDMSTNNIVGAPASWTSLWEFEDVILESGTNYCFESMNSIDYATETYDVQSVMAVHYAGDYGGDAAAGAEYAAEQHGLEFSDLETPPGQDQQAGAIEAILTDQPDLVILTTGPAEAAAIVGTTAQQGFTGRFIGTSPTWNPALLESPAGPALTALYEQSGPWGPWGTETPGHAAMREALGNVDPSDGYTAGWVWSYPLKAALEAAVEADNLTREGLVEAAQSLTSVDYEGMLPPDAGNYGSDANAASYRASLVSKVDPAAPTGVSVSRDIFVGPTAQSYTLDGPCFQ